MSCLTFLFFLSASAKRRASSTVEAPSKKSCEQKTCNPSANENIYTNLVVLDNTPLSSRADFVEKNRPNFVGDRRIDRVQVYPRNDDDYNWLCPQSVATSSFHGDKCGSCLLPDGKSCNNPGNKGPKILLLGDEFMPVLAGSNGECCMTLRVEAGNFQQLEKFIGFQVKEGLKIGKGSIAIVSLVTHLRRTNCYEWWSDFAVFCEHMKKYNLSILPVLTPFPDGLEFCQIQVIISSFKWCQYRNFGSNDERHDKYFSLWKIFSPLASKSGAPIGNYSVPNLRIFGQNGTRRLVKCSGPFPTGFPGDFANGLPRPIEECFLIMLFDELRKIVQSSSMPMASIKVPSSEAVVRGLLTTAERDLPNKGRSIFLVGNSNLKATGVIVEREAAALGVKVFNFSRGVDHQTLFTELSTEQNKAIRSAAQNDLLILDFFGNSMITQTRHYGEPLPLKQYVRHVENPCMLSNNQLDCLLNDTLKILDWASKNFRGKVILCGPCPRYLSSCCAEKSHTIIDVFNQKVNMESYTNTLNRYIKDHLCLPENCEFFDYRACLSGPLSEDDFSDRVHYKDHVRQKFASFIVSCLKKKQTPPVVRPAPAITFHDALYLSKVYAFKGDFNASALDTAEEMSPPTIDDAIGHVCPPVDPTVHPLDVDNPPALEMPLLANPSFK